MKAVQITFVLGDDWEGVYLNGKLKHQGHSISAMELANTLVNYGRVMSVQVTEPDEEWLQEQGRLPDKLSDVSCAERP